jgi:hypothetical protein
VFPNKYYVLQSGTEFKIIYADAATAWEAACTQALTERAKFGPIYKNIMEQRLKL